MNENNEYISSAHEPSPNEMAAKIAEMEEQLKVLRAEDKELKTALEQHPENDSPDVLPGSEHYKSYGYTERRNSLAKQVAEIEEAMRGYYHEKNKQMELDLEPEK